MDKTCQNCKVYRQCVYRGIYNPCDDWRPTAVHANLRKKAIDIQSKPMSFVERQFVLSATTLEFFTPKQMSWLRSIHKRVA